MKIIERVETDIVVEDDRDFRQAISACEKYFLGKSLSFTKISYYMGIVEHLEQTINTAYDRRKDE